MKITLWCITDSDKHFASAIDEYIKRLGKDLRIQALKPIKHDNRAIVIQKETDMMLSRLASDQSYKLLLHREGKPLTTEQRVTLLERHSPISCILGGPFGLDEQRMPNAVDQTVSFGAHTMPHGLAKLVLLEQLYRAKTIMDGKSYHY